jgi:hypothetical protein
MNESEWLSSSQPETLLTCLKRSGRASERKVRLFAIACCRRVSRFLGQTGADAVEAGERYADGLLGLEELGRVRAATVCAHRAFGYGRPPTIAMNAVVRALWEPRKNPVGKRVKSAIGEANVAAAWASLALSRTVTSTSREAKSVRSEERKSQCHLLRDIFGPLALRPLPPLSAAVLAWNDTCVVKLARSIYEEGAFSCASMGILADALEDAGLVDQEMLAHLRGPLPHTRGCYLLDQLLGKE